MRINIGGKSYVITWTYRYLSDGQGRPAKIRRKGGKIAHVTHRVSCMLIDPEVAATEGIKISNIVKMDDNSLSALNCLECITAAFCSATDQNDREEGRFWSIKRMIEGLYPYPSRTEFRSDPEGSVVKKLAARKCRAEIWDAYWATKEPSKHDKVKNIEQRIAALQRELTELRHAKEFPHTKE